MPFHLESIKRHRQLLLACPAREAQGPKVSLFLPLLSFGMQSLIKAKKPYYSSRSDKQETKQGVPIYGGSAHEFHEWKFRTQVRYDGCKDDDKPALAGKVLEGLKGHAFQIAMNMGPEKLHEKDGVLKLIDAIEQSLFPKTKQKSCTK